MHATDLIATAIPLDDPDRPPLPSERRSLARCAVTGEPRECVRRGELLGKSFTDGDLLAAPTSEWVGVHAYTALRYRWERMSSWWCDGVRFVRLSRRQVRECVLSGTRPAGAGWSGYATTSYKKHGALRAPVNPGDRGTWLFETRLVDCADGDRVLRWWARLNEALAAGFGRASLESLDPHPVALRRAGVEAWLLFERWAWRRHGSGLYDFLCYLLPSQEELRARDDG